MVKGPAPSLRNLCSLKLRPAAFPRMCCALYMLHEQYSTKRTIESASVYPTLNKLKSFGRGCRRVVTIVKYGKTFSIWLKGRKMRRERKRSAVQNGKQSSHREGERKNKEIRDRKKKGQDLMEHIYGNINRKGEPGNQKCGISNSANFFAFLSSWHFFL